MELKVWVEGIQRIVCGVTEKTTCQDVVYALAHATGKTGRFTLIERWRHNERLLAPQENPLKVLQKWGEYSQDVQFILQRSALEGAKNPQNRQLQDHRGFSGPSSSSKEHQMPKENPPPAVWKPPPSTQQKSATNLAEHNARLSPDSGRGSDRTGGSDTSNGFSSDKDLIANQRRNPQASQYNANSFGSQQGRVAATPTFQQPPAYRPPPPHTSSPSEHPPPYRNPPPPPNKKHQAQQNPGRVSYGQMSVRPPHYSPPPTHRATHLSRHPSRTSLSGASNSQQSNIQSSASHAASRMNQHGLPSRQIASLPSSRVRQLNYPSHHQNNHGPPTDLAELVNLVSAQQSTLYSQHADIKQCDAEATYLESNNAINGIVPNSFPNHFNMAPNSVMNVKPPEAQYDLVLSEVKRLEEVAQRNDHELGALGVFNTSIGSTLSGDGQITSKDDLMIKNEISQLKQRLAGTDQELQKTNSTLRRLGDEMRSMSIEKNKQREQELIQEIERLQMDIKVTQKSSEEGANISQQLSKEVKDVEEQISKRKSEVEKLIKEMREANMESLAISPPEESKQFLDGPMKPGTTRKMMGSPRALENAVPTAKNPHGVWV